MREYNQKWNFFDGTTEAELNAQRSKDKVWERETKPMGDPEARAWARLGIEDPHQVLGANSTQNKGRNTGGGRRLPPTERRAIEILEANDSWTKAEVRKAYKKLIKSAASGHERRRPLAGRAVAGSCLGLDQIKDSRNFK